VVSFNMSAVPVGRKVTGATLKFSLKKSIHGDCPVVPMVHVCKLPPEMEFNKWPDSVWRAFEIPTNEVISFPLQEQASYAVTASVDSKLVRYIQGCLKGRQPRVLVLGFRAATERCVMHDLGHPIDLELTLGNR